MEVARAINPEVHDAAGPEPEALLALGGEEVLTPRSTTQRRHSGAGARRGAGGSGSWSGSWAPLPLPRACLSPREEPWEEELLRLPARLLLFLAPPSPPPSPPTSPSPAEERAWRERCAGEVRLLRDGGGRGGGGGVRVLMKRDKSRAPCLSHWLTLDMELRPCGLAGASPRAWAYAVQAECGEGRPRSREVALLFQNSRDARRWRAAFEHAQCLLQLLDASDA